MSILLRSLKQIFPGFARFIPLFVSIRERAAMIIREFGIELGWERFLRALQRCRRCMNNIPRIAMSLLRFCLIRRLDSSFL